MKPFFGLSNHLACIIISFIIFGYAVYSVFAEGILYTEHFRVAHIHETGSHSVAGPGNGRSLHIRYNFDSTTTSLFGLYEMEIAVIKVCITVLLFIVLIVGAAQRSKILLRIWMLIQALVIVLGFLATIISLTDSHLNSYNGMSTNTVTRLLITLACSLWFFAVVLSLHEEIEMEDSHAPEGNIVRSYIVAKKGDSEKCPPYYDC